MSQFEKMFSDMKSSENFEENARLLQFVGNVLKNSKQGVPADECAYIRDFAVGEMQRLLLAIPKAENYKAKDGMFFYENNLLMVFTLACKDMSNVSEEQMQTINQLVKLVSGERVVENAVDEMFKLEKIEKSDLDKLFDTVKPLTDEYQRGIFYQGLNEFKEKIKNMTAEAKTALADFVAEDMARLMDAEELDEDKINTLEFAADVCKHFINEKLLDVLNGVLALKISRISYYALETLLENNKEISVDTVAYLAEDLTYAELTYSLLAKHGKCNIFPKEYTSREYLAKSDLVHWLTYPTELGKQPDEISLLGEIKVKGEVFHVFKFKSDSDNLSDDLKNEYLIGWSGNCGGTFSDFDKLADYEKKNDKKTLKYIAKTLLK